MNQLAVITAVLAISFLVSGTRPIPRNHRVCDFRLHYAAFRCLFGYGRIRSSYRAARLTVMLRAMRKARCS